MTPEEIAEKYTLHESCCDYHHSLTSPSCSCARQENVKELIHAIKQYGKQQCNMGYDAGYNDGQFEAKE